MLRGGDDSSDRGEDDEKERRTLTKRKEDAYENGEGRMQGQRLHECKGNKTRDTVLYLGLSQLVCPGLSLSLP